MIVTQIGRLQWYVESETRDGLTHLVDFEEDTGNDGLHDPREPAMRCSCEAWNLIPMRPCKHVMACIDELVNEIRLTKSERKHFRWKLRQLAMLGGNPKFHEHEEEPEREEQEEITHLRLNRRCYILAKDGRKYQPRKKELA